MTLYEFNQLDEMEQQEAIWEAVTNGTYKDGTFLYACYQIDAFYFETKRHIEFDVLHGLRSFAYPDLLAPYLNQMNIKID
jgi:hypothetical protein